MTKLVVYLCSFSVSGLNDRARRDIISVIGSDFCKCYGVSGTEVKVELKDGESDKWDLAVAYDSLPGVTDAVSTRLNQFRDLAADDLFAVLPSSLGYGGRVTVRNISSILGAGTEKAGSREETEREEEEEEDPGSSYEKMARQFQAETPRFSFDQLVLEEDVKERMLEAVSILENREILFEEWNLKSIMSPSVLLNLYGEPGTGKSMAAEALADRLGKKIIRTAYADIESKYHGEGPKRLKAIFLAARQQDAVLFIDEADSMLSARLTNVSDGSAQAINSMRSQLLISLENHDGIVVFATNLIENYDRAFLTRLICLELRRPGRDARKKIWFNHLYPRGDDEKTLRIPLAEDIDLEALSAFDFCGRDIRNAVKQACIATVMKGKPKVDQTELTAACQRTEMDLKRVAAAAGRNRAFRPEAVSEAERARLIKDAAKILKEKETANGWK